MWVPQSAVGSAARLGISKTNVHLFIVVIADSRTIGLPRAMCAPEELKGDERMQRCGFPQELLGQELGLLF